MFFFIPVFLPNPAQVDSAVRKTSRPRVIPRLPDPNSPHRQFTSSVTLPECPQLKILRIDDSLYFESVSYVREMLRLFREHYPDQNHLLLLTKGINQVDVAGSELLVSEAGLRRQMGGNLYLYRLKDSACDVLERSGYMDVLNREHIYGSKEEAIGKIFENLDKDICKNCDKRIFLECKKIPYSEPNEIEGGS
ncbi:MAG: sodium-independent anion transporter [Gammaproteobacteria bacterium]|nr:sodium-independent anion transporter [Gammaproteobacteria bacterium]